MFLSNANMQGKVAVIWLKVQ